MLLDTVDLTIILLFVDLLNGWDQLDVMHSGLGSCKGLKARHSIHYYLIRKLGHEIAL